MTTRCFCKKGIMSQCTVSRPEQVACRFYEKSMVADRCMNVDENLSNHCWCPKAQAYGYYPHGRDDYMEEELLLEEAELDEYIEPRAKSCIDCILYTCSYVISENTQAQSRGGLNHDDLVKIASKCPDYEDEETMQAKINMSLRGHRP